MYGEEPLWQQGFTFPEVDRFYLKVIKAASEMGKPVFGICKGIQAINVAFGGSLYQDIPSQLEKTVKHSQSAPRDYGTHKVMIEEDSFLGECLPKSTMINSFHHQSVNITIPIALSGSFTTLAAISVISRFTQYIPTCLAVLVFRKRGMKGALLVGIPLYYLMNWYNIKHGFEFTRRL